jgi:hypothetical protein
MPLSAWKLLQHASSALHSMAPKVLWIFADRESPVGVNTHTHTLTQSSDKCRMLFCQQDLQADIGLFPIQRDLHNCRSGQALVAYDVNTLVVDRFHFGESVGELAAQQQQPGFRPTYMRCKLWHLVSYKHPQPDYHLFTGTQVSRQRLHRCSSSVMCLCMTRCSGIL